MFLALLFAGSAEIYWPKYNHFWASASAGKYPKIRSNADFPEY